MVLDDRLRNPWGILHGGAVAMLADEAACRAVAAVPGASGPHGVAAADAVLHYLRPVRVGPVEARCSCSVPGRDGPWCGWRSMTSGPRTAWTNLGTITVLAV